MIRLFLDCEVTRRMNFVVFLLTPLSVFLGGILTVEKRSQTQGRLREGKTFSEYYLDASIRIRIGGKRFRTPQASDARRKSLSLRG